jgi:hypothetical protein
VARLYDIRPKKRSAYKKDYKNLAPRTKRRYRAAIDYRPKAERRRLPIDRLPRQKRQEVSYFYHKEQSYRTTDIEIQRAIQAYEDTYGEGSFSGAGYTPTERETRPSEPKIGTVQDAYYGDELEDVDETSEDEAGGYYDEYYFDYPEEGIEGYSSDEA